MVSKTQMFRAQLCPGSQYRIGTAAKQPNVKFGQMTMNTKIFGQKPVFQTFVNSSNVEKRYGTNVYDVLNTYMPNNTSSVNNTNNVELQSNAGVNANTNKSSAEVLSSVRNAGTYGELSAAKTELEVGKDNLTASYNDSVSSYVDENVQATLSELGIEIPTLARISGEYEDYEQDMKTFEKGKNTCQASQDECNGKLPEISEKKCVAKSRVDSLKSTVSNLTAQIVAAKLAGQDTSALEAQLQQAKSQLKEAQEELKKYEKQENALKDGISQLDEKKAELDKNAEDLTNYHEAESEVVDKTYDIARDDDQKLNENLTKLKTKKREIENAARDNNTSATNGSDDARNQRLERLQKEYEKIVLDTSDVFVDMESLIKDNDGGKNVKNSNGNSYTINNFDEAKKILTEDQN